jgi:hypothetical protein
MTHMNLTHRLKYLGLSMAIVSLAACGGSGDDDDPLPTDTGTDAVAKDVGSWKSDCYADSGASALLRADFTKAAADTLGGSVIVYYYIGSSCSGPSVKSDKVLSNISLKVVGAKTVDGVTADKFQGSSDQGTKKTVLYTNGSTLQIGDPDATEDAEGYPNSFFKYALKRLS